MQRIAYSEQRTLKFITNHYPPHTNHLKMYHFTFDDNRYKEIRNKRIVLFVVSFLVVWVIYFIKEDISTGIDIMDRLTPSLIINPFSVILILYLIENRRQRKIYNQIQIIIDDNSITHIEPDKDDAIVFFKDIKSITQSKQGLHIQTIYPASSLKVLAQMQGYNQIVELLSAVKPIKKRTILSRNFWVELIWPATVFLAVIFKDFIFDSAWLINAILGAGTVLVCTRFYHLQTSPYVNKDDKWASSGLIVVAILLLAILIARLAA